MEIGDREPAQSQPAFGKLKHWEFSCLHECADFIDLEKKNITGETSGFSPIMENDHEFKFKDAVNRWLGR